MGKGARRGRAEGGHDALLRGPDRADAMRSPLGTGPMNAISEGVGAKGDASTLCRDTRGSGCRRKGQEGRWHAEAGARAPYNESGGIRRARSVRHH